MYEISHSENKRITLYPGNILVEDSIGDNHIHTNICYKCDKIFATHSELSKHSLSIHNSHLSYTCNLCDKTFITKAYLSSHHVSDHLHLAEVCPSDGKCDNTIPKNPSAITARLPCYKCDKAFEQFCDLTNHIRTFHDPSQFYPCEECEIALPTLLLLELHIESEHNSPLPQYDGPIQENFDFSPPKNVRTASYSLNKQKQINDIQKDAHINDFEVSVNNLDQNATIKCSSGFYTQVALPSFSTLEKRSIFTKSKVAISVDEVSITKDSTGLESNRLLYFSFMNEQKNVGGVTVHLHHSTRTIQIQGSHFMPDSTRAALWFVNNVTLSRFKEQAKAKKYAIKAFNEAAKKLPVTQISENIKQYANCCQSCFSTFNTQSKPSICNFCSKYFHKTNCLKDHTKMCPMSSKAATNSTHQSSIFTPPLLPVATATSSSNSTPCASSLSSSTEPLLSNSNAASLTVNPPQSSTSSLPFPPSAMQGLQTSVTFVPSIPTMFTATSDPSRSSTLRPPAAHIPSAIQNQQKKTTSKKNSIPTSPQDIKIEFLQTELAAAQTRIVQLDAALKDKEQMTSVLLARINGFEERENLKTFQTYFPDNTSRKRATETSSSASHSTSPSFFHPPRCCSNNLNTILRCCNHHSCSSSANDTYKYPETTNNLEQKLDSITKDTKGLQIAVNQLQIALNKLFPQEQSKGDTNNVTDTETIPTSPLTVNLATNSPKSTSSPNCSIASLEEFLPVEPSIQNFSPSLNL